MGCLLKVFSLLCGTLLPALGYKSIPLPRKSVLECDKLARYTDKRFQPETVRMDIKRDLHEGKVDWHEKSKKIDLVHFKQNKRYLKGKL
jgi:adenylate cyclase